MTAASAAPIPATADPAALVDAAMRSLSASRGHLDQYDGRDPYRALPEVQAIITAPVSVRRRCILIAARQDQ